MKTLCHVVVPLIFVFQDEIRVTETKDLSQGAVSMIAQMATSLLNMFQKSIYGVAIKWILCASYPIV